MAKQKEETEKVEQVEETKTEQTPEPKKPKIRTIISGAEFWDFDEEPIFIGRFKTEVLREEDVLDKDGKKVHSAGDTMGYLFEAEEDGEEHIVGNSHQIQKALELVKQDESVNLNDAVFYIEFLGKGENSKKQPFNRFKIGLLE